MSYIYEFYYMDEESPAVGIYPAGEESNPWAEEIGYAYMENGKIYAHHLGNTFYPEPIENTIFAGVEAEIREVLPAEPVALPVSVDPVVAPLIGPRTRFATILDIPLVAPLVAPRGDDDAPSSWRDRTPLAPCGDEDCTVDGFCSCGW